MNPVRQLTYQAGHGGGAADVEVLPIDAVVRALRDHGTQRADFHVLGVIETGRGTVSIDFATYPLVPRSAVWVPPGAVHQWQDTADVTGHLVLFVPTAPRTRAAHELTVHPCRPVRWDIPDHDWPLVAAAVDHLALETAATTADHVPELPSILLSALLGRLRPPSGRTEPDDTTYRRFAASVEANFRVHHDAAFYAHELGYAPRTLSRIVQKATGHTAKADVTSRIALEAKRLLSHDRFTAARCASELGFADPSSFSMFFQRVTGTRPGAWLNQHSGAPVAGRTARDDR